VGDARARRRRRGARAAPFRDGGRIVRRPRACHVAARHSSRLHALVLVDGAFVDPEELEGGDVEQRVRSIREEHAQLVWDDWESFVEFATHDARRDLSVLLETERDWLVERDGKLCARHDADTLEAMVRGAAPYPSLDTFRAIRAAGVPVLLLRATEPPERGDRLRAFDERFARELPEAQIRSVPDAGHDLVWDVGPPLADLIADWLALKT
jgi:pimeloyl-ACP methyl ester carboxylesterase